MNLCLKIVSFITFASGGILRGCDRVRYDDQVSVTKLFFVVTHKEAK